MENYEVLAPLKNHENRINFEKVRKAKDIFLNYVVADNNPSEFVFPKRETLFSFHKEKDKVTLHENTNDSKKVIFGARPCDAAALKKLDKLFNWDGVKDGNYNARREKTIVIGVACNKADNTCFCTSVDVSPHQKENMDIVVYILDKRKDPAYMLEVVSKKGEELSRFIKGNNSTGKDEEERKKLEKEAVSSIRHGFDHNQLKDELDGVFHHVDFWKQQTNKCIRCGICAMVCPTCYCFDMADEKDERCRFWDACTLKMFTKEASGFNPRADKFRGYRQRFYHKFNFFNKVFEESLCVGCGRCILNCPTKVDILEIALHVSDSMSKEEDLQKIENTAKVC